jgi:hypothetical protein
VATVHVFTHQFRCGARARCSGDTARKPCPLIATSERADVASEWVPKQACCRTCRYSSTAVVRRPCSLANSCREPSVAISV